MDDVVTAGEVTGRVTTIKTRAIGTALRREDIEIAFPQRDLHLRPVDPGAAEVLGSGEPSPR